MIKIIVSKLKLNPVKTILNFWKDFNAFLCCHYSGGVNSRNNSIDHKLYLVFKNSSVGSNEIKS